MKNYDEMSDFEINKLIADLRGGFLGHVGEWLPNGVKVRDSETGIFYTERDYCNNPSDAWSIIVENEIAIKPCVTRSHRGIWMASDNYAIPEFLVKDKNPLRAAMICFLKMKDTEK